MNGKSRGKPRRKCKAPDPEPAAEAHPAYRRPWVKPLLDDALGCLDLAAACRRAGVSLAELVRARATDPAIDGAFQELDDTLRAAAINAVVAKAAAGDLPAIRALTDGTLALLDPTRGDDAMPAHVAEAMIAAGLKAAGTEVPEVPNPVAKLQCPRCHLWSTWDLAPFGPTHGRAADPPPDDSHAGP
jgi:hypothetical protein